jgi:predicted  nucleic acid-binding Zn-ribbon protein
MDRLSMELESTHQELQYTTSELEQKQSALSKISIKLSDETQYRQSLQQEVCDLNSQIKHYQTICEYLIPVLDSDQQEILHKALIDIS